MTQTYTHAHGRNRSPWICARLAISFECDSETQQGIKARLEANGHPLHVTDHGYYLSPYMNDPNN
jgi:hypothetical protein